MIVRKQIEILKDESGFERYRSKNGFIDIDAVFDEVLPAYRNGTAAYRFKLRNTAEDR